MAPFRIANCLPEEILAVRSRRATRAKRAQMVQHVSAAGVLIAGGFNHLHHNPVLAVAEILAGAPLIGAVVVEKVRHDGHSKVAWVEFAGAVMTLVEAVERTRGKHHTLFYVLAYAAPALLFLFAIFDARINALQYIKADDEGIEVRTGIFFAKHYSWSEIDRVDLKGVVDPERAREWINAAAAARSR